MGILKNSKQSFLNHTSPLNKKSPDWAWLDDASSNFASLAIKDYTSALEEVSDRCHCFSIVTTYCTHCLNEVTEGGRFALGGARLFVHVPVVNNTTVAYCVKRNKKHQPMRWVLHHERSKT
jgi:hypothetical protein